MVTIPSLLLPVLVSAFAVFVLSFVANMVLPHHRTDFAKLPGEDQAMGALRALAIPPGEYVMPHGGSPAAMKDPAYVAKQNLGPVALVTVLPNGPPAMGRILAVWFVHLFVVGIFVAYLTGRALPADAEARAVFRFAATVAFIAHVVAGWPFSIWYGRKWSSTVKTSVDGLAYALVTGAVFAWLWPV